MLDPVVTPSPTPQAPATPPAPAPAPTPASQEPAIKVNAEGLPEFLTAEDIAQLQRSFVKEGDEYVYRNPDTSTMYHGKTIGEVVQQMLSGISEKDRMIASGKNTITRPSQMPSPRPGTQPSVPQTLEGDEPKPPDASQVRQEVFDRLLRQSGIDQKLLRMTDDDWKNLELEVGFTRANDLFQQKKEFLRNVERTADSELASANVVYANEVLGAEAVDTIIEWCSQQKLDMDQATFDNLLDRAYMADNAWTKAGRLNPARVAMNFQQEAMKLKPASPLRQSINADADPSKKIPPGVQVPPPGPSPSAAPPVASPTTLAQAMDRVKERLMANQK